MVSTSTLVLNIPAKNRTIKLISKRAKYSEMFDVPHLTVNTFSRIKIKKSVLSLFGFKNSYNFLLVYNFRESDLLDYTNLNVFITKIDCSILSFL